MCCDSAHRHAMRTKSTMRDRSRAAPSDLAGVCRPLCVRHGISFCTYADEHPCAAGADLIEHPKGSGWGPAEQGCDWSPLRHGDVGN